MRLKGHGDYKAILAGLKSVAQKVQGVAKAVIPDGTFEKVGSLIGNKYGGEPGGIVGAALGRKAAQIAGFGDYVMSVAANDSAFVGGLAPQFVGSKAGVRLRHTEQVTLLSGSSPFTYARNWINPGNSLIFPWLSTIAPNYELYKIHGMVFHYRPLSSAISTAGNASLGEVMFASQYDVLDNDFTGRAELLNVYLSSSSTPAASFMHAIECDNKQRIAEMLKVRNGALPGGASRQLYDFCDTTWATQGMQSAYTVGEIWVSYDIELIKPYMVPCSGARFAGIYVSKTGSTGGDAAPFDLTTVQYDAKSNLPIFSNGGVLTAPVYLSSTSLINVAHQGYYRITFIVNCPGTTITAGPVIDFISNTPGAQFGVQNVGGFDAVGSYAVATAEFYKGPTASGNIRVTGPATTGSYNASWAIYVDCLPYPCLKTNPTVAGQIDKSATYPLLLTQQSY